MIRSNAFRLILLSLLLTVSYSKSLKPNGKEKRIEISGIVKNQNRSYYYVDNNGLSYSKLNKILKNGDKFILKIVTRTNIAPQGSSYKSYGYELVVSDKSGQLFNREVKYRKKRDKSTSSESKKGFSFTDAGFWYEELTMTKNLNIKLKPFKNDSDVYARLIIEKINDREDVKGKISTINKQQTFTLSYINSEDKNVTSRGWVLLDKNLDQKFKIEGPSIIRVYSRYIYDENNELDTYKIKLKQDGHWMSEPIFDKEKSDKNAVISSKKFENKMLSKYKSFYFNVPEGSHYYSFEILDDGKYSTDKVLIKLDEYKISQ
tara:strand:- start:535 stop:1488 length:954 start_codon:yes stop_codon:yes gene_type:complete